MLKSSNYCTSLLASLRLSFKVRYSINKSLAVKLSVSKSAGGEVDMGLDNDDNSFENNGYFYTKEVPFKITGSSGSCKYTEARKEYEEAKSRALTLANETFSSDTAKQSCKNFLATLLSLAGTKLAGSSGVQMLIQGLVRGEINPETFTAELQIHSYLSTDERKCLIPYLKRSLPFFQIALLKREVSIDGIHPKPITKPNALMGHIGFTHSEVTRNQSIEVNISITNDREFVPEVPTSQSTQALEVNEITLRNNSITIDSDSIKNVMDVFKPDGNNMIPCKGCGANCKDIRRHLIKMRHSIKCETKYSYEQLLALYNEGAKSIGQYNDEKLTENSKAKEVTKIGQIIEEKLEGDANFGKFFQKIPSSMNKKIESEKAYKEAKTRALTLANETWNSDTAKLSCKNFLATLLRLARTKLSGLEVLKLIQEIQDLIDGALDPQKFTAKLQLDLYLSSDESDCLMPFLKRSLGYIKNDLQTRELSIDVIQPPPKERKLAMKKELAKNNESKEVTKIGEMTEAKLEPVDTNIANVGESVPEIAESQLTQVLEVNKTATGNVEDITKGLFSFTIVYFLIICFITFAWQMVVKLKNNEER